MRICLYWNETAGGGLSLHELTTIISGAGHDLVREVEDASELPSNMDDVDVVVAAGGDGTVARAARTLAGGTVPLAILPLGTANNIAGSLGIQGDAAQLVRRWRDADVATIDIGAVDLNGRSRMFVESVGCGIVTSCIEIGRATLEKGDRDSHLSAARDLYLDTLRDLRPRHYDIVLDGERIAGEFLLVEALNTPSIGPRVRFTADVTAADGYLSVVVVPDSERAMLCAYLTALKNGSEAAGAFKSWRASTIEIAGADRAHVDDQVVDAGTSISLSVRPSSLRVLA